MVNYSKPSHLKSYKLFSPVHPKYYDQSLSEFIPGSHKACHVEYKHAGLHRTDYRTALWVEN